MTKPHRTAEDLVQLYQLARDGISSKDIAEQLGTVPSSVSSSYRLLQKYIRGKTTDQAHHSHAYKAAAKEIRRLLRSQKAVEPASSLSPTHNSYDRLADSFSLFQESVASFIEDQVASRVQRITTENVRLKEENKSLAAQLA